MDIKLLPGERIDDLQFSHLRIIQNKTSFCFGMDAVLLADFAMPKETDQVVDLGCSGGILPLLMYGRQPSARYTGIDIDEEALERGNRSLLLNHIPPEKILLKYADIRSISHFFPVNSASLVVCNPPYYTSVCTNTRHKGARMEASCSLSDAARAARFLLKNRGRFCLIYPASRIQEAFMALSECGLCVKRFRLIQNSDSSRPKLMLIESLLGAKMGEVQVLPSLLLTKDGHDSEELLKIYHRNPGTV